ncbi:DNA-binding response regulator OS=Streptomyces antimycoticus OX=68175 GN=desR_2 PE=4 SV=1 [Streptomyces antimycoticus]
MVRVLIAEDMHMLRKALVALLEFEPDIEVVAEFSNGADILPRARELRPDVAVLDIDLPGTGTGSPPRPS